MTCDRCQHLLLPELCYTPSGVIESLRCTGCGDIIDEQILRNRNGIDDPKEDTTWFKERYSSRIKIRTFTCKLPSCGKTVTGRYDIKRELCTEECQSIWNNLKCAERMRERRERRRELKNETANI